jgi:hypothetical protein
VSKHKWPAKQTKSKQKQQIEQKQAKTSKQNKQVKQKQKSKCVFAVGNSSLWYFLSRS